MADRSESYASRKRTDVVDYGPAHTVADEWNTELEWQNEKNAQAFVADPHTRAGQFLIDPQTGGRKDPEAWKRMVEASVEGPLDAARGDQFATDVATVLSSAKETLRWDTSHTEPRLAEADRALRDKATETILRYTGMYPPAAVGPEGTETQMAWTHLVNTTIEELAADGRHAEIPAFLRETNSQAERFQTTGIPPEGDLSIDAHIARERLETPAEAAAHQEGYNVVHTTEYPKEGDPQVVLEYIRERMQEWLGDTAENPITAVTFAKAFVDPHLSEGLSESFAHYDMAEELYMRGTISEDNGRRLLHGPTDDPATHLGATYNRTIRNMIANTGIAEAADRGDRTEFAIGTIRTGAMADELGIWLEGAAAHPAANPEAERRDPLGYEAPLEWQMPKTEKWNKILEVTNDLTEPAVLRENARDLEIAIMGPMASRYGPIEPHTAYQKVITEAIRDLIQAQDALDTVAYDSQREEKREEAAEYLAANAEHATSDSPAVTAFVKAYTESIADHERSKEQDGLKFAPAAAQMREELLEAGIDEERVDALTADPKKAAMYDRAAHLLAHADFNLSVIHQYGGPAR